MHVNLVDLAKGFPTNMFVEHACKSCRPRQEVSKEYVLAKFGVDAEENAPSKKCAHLAGKKIRERVRYRTCQLRSSGPRGSTRRYMKKSPLSGRFDYVVVISLVATGKCIFVGDRRVHVICCAVHSRERVHAPPRRSRRR